MPLCNFSRRLYTQVPAVFFCIKLSYNLIAMDLEHLTKHQIVLLTLLVSLITSITTGIVTVSLMSDESPSVVRTINQIVERTVETVVPSVLPDTRPQAAAVVTKETTVVVKDDDLATQSITKVQKGIVRLVSKNDPDVLVARGVVVSERGMVLSDRKSLESLGTTSFEAILPTGDRVAATMRIPVGTTTVAVLDLAMASSSGKFAPAALADISKVRLGQSVIRIGGTGADTVGTGVVAKLPDAHSDLIQASVVSTTPGSILMTVFGEVVGLITADSAKSGPDFYTLATSP